MKPPSPQLLDGGWLNCSIPSQTPCTTTRGPQMWSVGSTTLLSELLVRFILMLLNSRRYKYIRGIVLFSIARYTVSQYGDGFLWLFKVASSAT